MRLGWLLTLVPIVTAAACNRRAETEVIPVFEANGVYTFSERASQTSDLIEGTVTILRDSVLVDARPGPCRRQESTRDVFVYQCSDVTLTFNRFDPVNKATYRLMTTVYDHKLTCVRYTTDSAGHQVCAQQQTETTERQVPVSGMLHLKRPVGSS